MSTMTMNEIDKRILSLEENLANPPKYPTEVYTRIVGYYRSLAAWNKGKREEYNHRTPFSLDGGANTTAVVGHKDFAQSYVFFFRQTCPACPMMKKKLETLDMAGISLDTDSEEGLTQAIKREVTATPTVIFLDAEGKEIERLSDPRDWERVTTKVVSPV